MVVFRGETSRTSHGHMVIVTVISSSQHKSKQYTIQLAGQYRAPDSACPSAEGGTRTAGPPACTDRHCRPHGRTRMLREDLFARYGGGMNARKQDARLDGLYPIGERWREAYEAWLGERAP